VTGGLAVVTGAARGLGLAIAKRLIAANVEVAAVDMDGEVLRAALPDASYHLTVDVTDAKAVANRLGALPSPVTKVALCAGITDDAMVYKMTATQYRRVLDINLVGSLNVSEALLPQMVSAGQGRILYISSRAYLGNVGQANYAASKGGIVGIAKAQALHYGPAGISVNAIAPGLIRTRLTDAIPTEIRDGFIRAIPLGRIGEPDDVALAAMFLLGDDAGFISGQTLLVCGGRSVGAPLK